MNRKTSSEEHTCKGCGEVYQATIYHILGSKMVFDGGYCPTCLAAYLHDQDAKEEAARQAEIAKQRSLWRQDSGLPQKFMNSGFGTFEIDKQPKAYKRCLEYAERYPLQPPRSYPSLLLFSEKAWGLGKTHLVCSIAHHIFNKWNGEEIGCPILFTTEPDLFRRIQATYNIPREQKQWRETEDDVLRDLITVPLLILDDIGKEERADPRFVQRTLFAIIDGRYRRVQPMILTTNLGIKSLMAHLGGERSNEASFERLLEMCENKFVEMKGESYRRRKAEGR